MLARLSATAHNLRDWELQYGSTNVTISKEYDEGSLLVDFLALSLPRPEQTFQNVVNRCSNAVRGIQSTISGHLDSVTEALYQLEQDTVVEGSAEQLDVASTSHNISGVRPSLEGETIVDMPPNDPDTGASSLPIPTIIITACPDITLSLSSRVPIQNAAFGKQLTVPNYPAYNQAFPPQAAPAFMISGIKRWRWHNGHWEAELLSLMEQERKGLFAKMAPKRKVTRNIRSIRARNPHYL